MNGHPNNTTAATVVARRPQQHAEDDDEPSSSSSSSSMPVPPISVERALEAAGLGGLGGEEERRRRSRRRNNNINNKKTKAAGEGENGVVRRSSNNGGGYGGKVAAVGGGGFFSSYYYSTKPPPTTTTTRNNNNGYNNSDNDDATSISGLTPPLNDTLYTIPLHLQTLEDNGCLFSFACKHELNPYEMDMVDGCVNLTSFDDEQRENYVPTFDVRDYFRRRRTAAAASSPAAASVTATASLPHYSFILARASYLLPGVDLRGIVDPYVLSSPSYQKSCQPSGTKVWTDYAKMNRDTFRITKPIVPYLYSLTVQFKVGSVKRPQLDALERHLGIKIDAGLVLERTKRSIPPKEDGTKKAKSILLYTDLGSHVILVTHLTVLLQSAIPAVVERIVDTLGSWGLNETMETVGKTRRYLRNVAAAAGADDNTHADADVRRTGASVGEMAAAAATTTTTTTTKEEAEGKAMEKESSAKPSSLSSSFSDGRPALTVDDDDANDDDDNGLGDDGFSDDDDDETALFLDARSSSMGTEYSIRSSSGCGDDETDQEGGERRDGGHDRTVPPGQRPSYDINDANSERGGSFYYDARESSDDGGGEIHDVESPLRRPDCPSCVRWVAPKLIASRRKADPLIVEEEEQR